MTTRSETAKVITKLKAIRQTREGLAETVREALATGLTPTQIRDLSGLSRQTIYDYARTAPARPDAATGGTPTDTEEPAP